MKYIVDTFDPYMDLEQAKYRFKINDTDFCVKEVEIEGGKPKIYQRIDDTEERKFRIYDTFEDAMSYVRLVQLLNGGSNV